MKGVDIPPVQVECEENYEADQRKREAKGGPGGKENIKSILEVVSDLFFVKKKKRNLR